MSIELKKRKLSCISETFYSIICKAILSSTKGEIGVNEIYDFIKQNYIGYINKNWQNSVRHALSFKKKFFYHKPIIGSKIGLWGLVPGFSIEIQFQRKKINKKTQKQLYSQKCLQNVYSLARIKFEQQFYTKFYSNDTPPSPLPPLPPAADIRFYDDDSDEGYESSS